MGSYATGFHSKYEAESHKQDRGDAKTVEDKSNGSYQYPKDSRNISPKLRGIIQYYGHFNKTGLKRAMRLVNLRLIKWVINKYRRYRRKPRILAWRWLQNIYKCYPNLFVHWEYGYRP